MGCGNFLFGDDGFGPAIAQYLRANYSIPENVFVEDVGTAAAKLLFTLLHTDPCPRRIIIVDAVEIKGKRPGLVFEIPLDSLPESKSGAYAIHQFPDTNLLKALRDDKGIIVEIVACQVENIPDEVEEGLSDVVEKAIPAASEIVFNKIMSQLVDKK